MPDIDLQLLAQIERSFGSDELAQTSHWRSNGKSHIGHVRPVNEDAFLEATEQKLWCVADGMGGLSRGDYASKAVIKALAKFVLRPSLTESVEDLEAKLLQVNETCRTAFRNKKLGTTVAALLAYGDYCFYLWAGDSRIYRLRDNELVQVTDDHTVAQENRNRQAGASQNDHEEEAGRPSAHVLTRAIGVHKTLRIELQFEPLEAGDRFLLCSDGLYNALPFSDIRSFLGRGSTEDALDCLVHAALEQGGQDNITAIVVDAQAAQG